MVGFVRMLVKVVKQTVRDFLDADCPQMAASLAFYTVFSLPPLLVLVTMIAGLAYGQEAVEGRLALQIEGLIGTEAAQQIQTMIASAGEGIAAGQGLVATLLGAGALIFGATRAFAQLQEALNRVAGVKPNPKRSGIITFLVKRALSFGMIVGAGFVLLLSLAVSTAISAVGPEIQEFIPIPLDLSRILDFSMSLAVTTLLFAAIFGILPDARIPRRYVWTGAAVTAVLFVSGKFLIGLYLGQSNPGSTFGAAGSLVVILMWIYLSSMLLLLGAVFTHAWTRHRGVQIEPAPGAVRFIRTVVSDDES